MERAWLTAHDAVAGRRSTSRAAAAVEVLAMAPLVSATTLAAGLDMAVKNVTARLDAFTEAKIVVEVTHRSNLGLFELAGLAPLRDEVAPPRRPEPGRGARPTAGHSGRGSAAAPAAAGSAAHPDRAQAIDYSELEHWMAHADQVIGDTRRALDVLAREVDPDIQQIGSDGGIEVLSVRATD